MYLFAPVAFVMKVTALHLWSIFTTKSGENAKEREKRMHFDVAQRFGASIAGVKQTSLKLDGVTARGREKAAHLLSKPETGQLSYRAWTRKNRGVLRGAALPQYIGLFIFSRNILKIYKRREMRYDKEKKEKRR